MKVFIWVDPYAVSYGSSLLFAVAETVEQAREIATVGTPCSYGTPNSINDDNQAEWRSRIALGEPDRVLDVPCAEWHEWSE